MRHTATLVTLFASYCAVASAQSLPATPQSDRYLAFSTTDVGIRHEGIKWGFDTAWDDDANVRRSIAFMGKENVEVVRVSFQPTEALVNDEELTTEQRRAVNSRIAHARLAGSPELIINCDHPSVADYYTHNGQANASRWAKLIMVTTRLYQQAGLKVATISPFNEPDYTQTGQGTLANFREICRVLKTDYADELAGIRLSGGNTLNDDRAAEYYNTLKPYIDEGNTHQLAGSFANYANFFRLVRNDGLHASADEMHNVGDALVALEYGLQTGVWWGFDSRARGQMCRATHGDRLAYAENRDAWTAAAVYRNLQDDVIECFVGGSERQAANSSYTFVCADREVYFDGYGPTHEYRVAYPGGTGYQNGQTGAERVIDISYGPDVQPDTINGTYRLMNRSSRRVLSLDVTNVKAVASGVNVCVKAPTPAAYNNWTVTPVSNRVGGDFGYFYIRSAVNNFPIDIWNWSLTSGGDIKLFDGSGGNNEQWYLKYAGDGFYYIVSRHSNLYLTATATTNGANVNQASLATTDVRRHFQQWRIIPVDAACELNAPEAPTGLKAESQVASIKLEWTANTEDDLEGYMILRAIDGTDDWNTIARKVKGNQYIDNQCRQGLTYKYRIKAIDRSDNQSATSDSVVTTTLAGHSLVAWYKMEGTLADATANHLDARFAGSEKYSSLAALTKVGQSSFNFDGSTFLQLPYHLTNTDELTVAMWVRWTGNTAGNGQRLFDFGSSNRRCFYLTTGSGSGMRLAFVNGDTEQHLDCSRLSSVWRHVTVTIGQRYVRIYIDGNLAAETTDITLRPSDIAPVMNYLGTSQDSSAPLLKGYIDDLRIYNYELSGEAVRSIARQVVADVNLDGMVDTQDALKVYEHMQQAGKDDDQGTPTDVNEDCTVDTQDVLRIYYDILND